MTLRTNALLAGTMFALLAPTPFALAQDNGQDAAQTQSEAAGDTSQTWSNPEPIADIEDEDARIRAFSVLIGQSVYDEMLSAQAAQSMSDSDMASEDSDTSDSSQSETDQSDDAGADATQSADESATQSSTAAGANPMAGVSEVNVVDITSLLGPADVAALQLLAESNNAQLAQLQDFINLDQQLRTELEDAQFLPADVVGVQRSAQSLDIFVIPGWLTDTES